MHFDIIRAWKDAAYRQSLNEEQLETLPAHPVGDLELSDNELESVYGGNYGGGIAASSSASASRTEIHSYAVICDINIYSIDVKILNINLLSIGNTHSQVCVHRD